MRWRTKAEQVQEQRLVIALPPIWQESALRLPTVRDRRPAILGPLPVDAPVQLVGQRSDFALVRRFIREIGRRGQHARQQKCRIDGGQLTLPNTPSGLHVEKVIIKALVSCCIHSLALGAVPEKPQGSECSFDGLRAGDEATLYANRVGRQGQSHGSYAGGRALLGLVRDQPVERVDLVNEIIEGFALECVQHLRR